MYVRNKLVAAFYKLSLGLISVYGFWMTLASYGATAWRLFSTWALLIGTIYFCISALMLALSSKREAGDTPCPMLEGILIIAFIIQAVAVIACAINDEYIPGLTGFPAILTYYILPILTLLDWCLFNKKGLWRPMDPFYWLALPLSYCAMIILTANMLPSSTSLLYPVAFLDYNANGFWEMLSWLALLGLLILILGYILILLDAFMGGVISKHIVLPRIRTVTIEDDDEGTPDTDTEIDDLAPEETTETQETIIAEEIEVIEPDEIITAKPKAPRSKSKTAPSSSSAKTKPGQDFTASPKSGTAQKSTSSKTQKSPNSQTNSQNSARPAKSNKTQSKPKRKINDITKPKTK